jgi:anti-sigma regulatory factor (Ser/Thr protein kinase)
LLNHGWSSESIKRVLSSTQEAFLNAVEHGNGGQPELKVSYYAVLEAGGLRVLITDFGRGRKPPVRPSLHLGWKVIEAFSQEARLYCDVATHRTTAQLSFSQDGLSEQEVI